MAESFPYLSAVGIGNAYPTLSGLSASWLESLNAIHEQEYAFSTGQAHFIYDTSYLQRIISALEVGNEKIALDKLQDYIRYLEATPMSLLMQQYIFTDFMGEFTKLGQKYRSDLSVQSVSLIISSKSIRDFETAGRILIHDFCQKYTSAKEAQEDAVLYQLYEYILTHYSDYDISLEKIAEIFHVSTAIVRQAVLKYAGKTYKDYIIFLRIEYAKNLLLEEDLSIADICQKTGYGNISHFIRLFRKTIGVTPAMYRRCHMEK